MKNKSSNHSVEALYRQYHPVLVEFIRRKFPYLSVQDAEDLIQALFEAFQRLGTKILGDCSLESLKRHAFRLAIALIRARKAIKRGEGKVSSLDSALEAIGWEPVAVHTGYLETVEELEFVDRVLAEVKPILSERELILARIIYGNLPDELSIIEIRMEMTPMERQRFLPVRRDITLEEAEVYILRQISRSKASLQQKLIEVRAAMGE